MNGWAIVTAGAVYFVLGGLWFSPPLFGTLWDRAIGFKRPDRWKPGAIYYVGPLLGCLVVSFATAWLMDSVRPPSWLDAALLGFVAGLGYAGAITGVNAISPTLPRPGLYTAVTAGYHVTGITVVALILYAWP